LIQQILKSIKNRYFDEEYEIKCKKNIIVLIHTIANQQDVAESDSTAASAGSFI